MTQRPAVLIMQRHLAPLSGFLESAYDVYRFWEGPPIVGKSFPPSAASGSKKRKSCLPRSMFP